MRQLLPVLVLFISGCGSTNRFFWNRQASNGCCSQSCSQCSPMTSYSIGAEPSRSTVMNGTIIEGGVVHEGVYHGEVIDSGIIPSPNPSVLPNASSKSSVMPESVPAPSPDPET